MQVELETGSGLERRLTITIPSSKIDEEINKRLLDLSKRVRLDGFRPGKVPMNVIKRLYNAGVRQEVLGEMMQSCYIEAISQEKLNPAGAPKIEPSAEKDGKDFQFVAVIEVYPNVKISDFSAITVERPVAKIDTTDVDEMISVLRQQSRTFELTDRSSEIGDKVVFDYSGKIDGKIFEGGSTENANLELGSGQMIPGFEDGLIGLSTNDEKTLKLKFPEAYHSNELAGKDVEFACKMHQVLAPINPELNESFFERFGVKEGGIEAFRLEVSANMQRELQRAIKSKIKIQVMEGLLKSHDINAPSALVAQEIDRMREQLTQNQNGNQVNFDAKQLPSSLFEDEAKKRVSLGLLVGEIVKQCDVKLDDKRVRTMVEEMASAYQDPQDVIDWYYNNKQKLSQVEYVVLEEQVVDTILKSAIVREKEYSYMDVVKPEEKANHKLIAENNDVDAKSTEQASV